jgi:CRP-like cAMP-binding protein
MTTLTNQDLLKRCSLFGTLGPEEIESLASALTKRRFKRGEVVVASGGLSESLYILLAGTARVKLSNDSGREVILSTLRTGDFFGEMGLIDDHSHSATVVAESQLDLLVLSREGFLSSIMSNPLVALSTMRVLVRRLRNANQKIASFALSGVYGRVANVLMATAVQSEDGSMLITEKITLVDIAKMVGSSREMVSRAMKDFESQGFVQKLDGGILRIFERRDNPR